MKVRSATKDDASLIVSFIQKKAEYGRNTGAFSGMFRVTENKILKILFRSIPLSCVLFAGDSGLEVGFAFYGFRCSSFLGRPSIWLDDLYVDEDRRSQGAGAALMERLAQIDNENNCTHLAWNADARNIRGLAFYCRLGAEITEQHGKRCFLRWVPRSAA